MATGKDSENYTETGTVPSLDEHGGRVGIIPAEVDGIWSRRKTKVQTFLLLLLLIVPWTRFENSQTILMDIPNRKFTFFGVTLWAHEAPLVFLVLIIAGLGLFFVTAVWGRVWCGWACPQTVFIDLVYRRLEILIEGKFVARRRMKIDPWTPTIYFKKTLKWFSFFVVSSLIAHSLAAYFVGARELLQMMGDSPANNMTYFTIITLTTGLLLFNFGWFREQFCIIMCPYGRFQSALLDADSQVVLYDAVRGEPRRGRELAATPNKPTANKTGDCVACRRCVQVCPTGIDIRYGLQMECIACTACMDACDTMMEKMNRPKGLIRYGTQSGKAVTLLRPRSLIYLALCIVFFVILGIQLKGRKEVDIGLLRALEAPYQIAQDEQGRKVLLNHFKLHLKNQTHHSIKAALSIDSKKWGNQFILTTPENPVDLPGGEDKVVHVFVKYLEPWNLVQGQKTISFHMNDIEKDLVLVGPIAEQKNE
ncbi:MAG: cytochrome c oxidase accessory protein CcoG [Bdellovibrionaceae bacterium]|nr:cytochrome c oxidase accessory protein CcoG [Pseudobdellovibrionaceae bacterium]